MVINSVEEMQLFAEKIGQLLKGGEVIELVGDVGAGKTTFVRGLAKGMGVSEQIQSPSFTINRVYDATNDVKLVHYDFYRLSDPGIMTSELQEAIEDGQTVVVIEWADAVSDVLPSDHLRLTISPLDESIREIHFDAYGESSRAILESIA